jgi:hypothetical protein
MLLKFFFVNDNDRYACAAPSADRPNWRNPIHHGSHNNTKKEQEQCVSYLPRPIKFSPSVTIAVDQRIAPMCYNG